MTKKGEHSAGGAAQYHHSEGQPPNLAMFAKAGRLRHLA
ncbi:hypothetical protein [Nitrobacter sp. JJSN]